MLMPVLWSAVAGMSVAATASTNCLLSVLSEILGTTAISSAVPIKWRRLSWDFKSRYFLKNLFERFHSLILFKIDHSLRVVR